MSKKAIVLLSGGIDSSITLFMAKEMGYECYPLLFDYGQRHKKELESAKSVSEKAGCVCRILKIDLPWKGSLLLDEQTEVAGSRPIREMPKSIPATYVPARNTIFLSFALSYAEAIGAEKIFIGANAVDFSGYPDCREPYFKAFESVIKEGTKAGIEGREISIEAPLLSMAKAQIIKQGTRLGVPYEDTWSCYDGKDTPCGVCDSCIIRLKGFEEAGIQDPLMKYGRA